MLGMQGAAARWTGENRSSYWFLVLYIAKNFMRSVSSVLLGDKKKGMWLIHIHHVISISCFAVGLFLHRLHFFGAMDGMCEISIIFLNNKFLYRDFGIAKGALYRVNLLALAVSWIATRLIAFPLWLALFLNDYYHHPMYAQGVSMFEMVVYPATTLIIWCLSVKWFGPIASEIMSEFGGDGDENSMKSGKKKKEN
mmetsp:Transcript_4118/g.6537  ORF Transcript_4118/g.6537 Transcript_4118/m.6537 type:complete len:196 (-) Transcript_4118:87-674(-)